MFSMNVESQKCSSRGGYSTNTLQTKWVFPHPFHAYLFLWIWGKDGVICRRTWTGLAILQNCNLPTFYTYLFILVSNIVCYKWLASGISFNCEDTYLNTLNSVPNTSVCHTYMQPKLSFHNELGRVELDMI